MTKAIDVIQQDHLNVDKVLKILENAVIRIQEFYDSNSIKPDLNLLFTIVYYMRTFPDNIHHPKEEEYLFPILLRRSPEAKPLIERLQSQHEEGENLLRCLSEALDNFDKEFPTDIDALQKATEDYVSFQRQHIGLEEREMIPLARTCLTPEDWVRINKIFADGKHPILGANLESGFKMLFERITENT